MKVSLVTAFPPSKVTLNEYGYYLAKHLIENETVSQLNILTDETEAGKAEVDFNTHGKSVTLTACWRFNSYRSLFRILREIHTNKPDVVLLNLQFMKFGDKKLVAALGLLLPLLLRMRGIPVVSLLHNILETVDLEKAGFTKNVLLQKVYGLAGSVLTRLILRSNVVALTISKYVSILQKKYDARNVVLMPHGSFEIPEMPSLELPEGPKRIMTFGKFGTYKKVEILIEAVQKLRNRIPCEYELVIAGTDSPNTPGYLEGVRAKYQQLNWVRFTGYVAEEDVAKTFTDSAVVVFPYTSTTGSSGVLHQAGSYARAVVMPDLGDLGILMREEGYQAQLFEPNDVGSLTEALQQVLTNETYRKTMATANYKAACALPMEQVVAAYVDQFKTLVKTNPDATLVKHSKAPLGLVR